jgi:hypothetical protein
MSRRKVKYHYPGGILAIPREVLRSSAFQALSGNAKATMMLLQDVWPGHGPVHYSTRRLAKDLHIAPNTAGLVFWELRDAGFLVLSDESDWLNKKARTYWLTWLSEGGREPTNDWKNYVPRPAADTVTPETVPPQIRSAKKEPKLRVVRTGKQ